MRTLYDHHGDIIKTIEIDGDKTTLAYWQDAEPVLDTVKRIGDGQDRKAPFQYVGSIPLTQLIQWLNEDGIEVSDYWKWPWKIQQNWLYRRFMSIDYRRLRAS